MTPISGVMCLRLSPLTMITEHNLASYLLALLEKEKSDDSENEPSEEPGRIVAPLKVEK